MKVVIICLVDTFLQNGQILVDIFWGQILVDIFWGWILVDTFGEFSWTLFDCKEELRDYKVITTT